VVSVHRPPASVGPRRPARKRSIEKPTVRMEHRVSLGGGEDEQPCHHPGRPPAERACRLERGSFVPGDLPLKRTEIVDPGLDLDDGQDGTGRVVREEVDPVMRACMDDLHLTSDSGSGSAQPPVDIGRATSVDQIPDPGSVLDDRRQKAPVDSQVQSISDLGYDIEGRVRSADLDAGDVPARDAHSIGQLFLRNAGPTR